MSRSSRQQSIEQFVQAVSQDIRNFAGNDAPGLSPLQEKEAELDALEDIRQDAEYFFGKAMTSSAFAIPVDPETVPTPRQIEMLAVPDSSSVQESAPTRARVSFSVSTAEKSEDSVDDSGVAIVATTVKRASISNSSNPTDGKKDDHASSSTGLGSYLGSLSSSRRDTVGQIIAPVQKNRLSRRQSVVGEYGNAGSIRSIHTEGKLLQLYLRGRKWWHEKVLYDVYPDDSMVTDRWLIYMERRVPPTFKANFLQLLGLGVSAVISGEFAGWNIGLHAGYGGFWVATVIAGLMYASLAFCLAEMSTAIPVTGGAFAYCRAVLDSWLGFVIGNSELVEYTSFICLVLVGGSGYVAEMLNIDNNVWGPLIMAFYLILGTVIVTRYNVLSWNLMAVLAITCGVQILIFSGVAAAHLDTSFAWGSPAELVSPTDPCVCAEVDETTGQCASVISTAICEVERFAYGITGIITVIPDAAWFFTGLECLSVASKEMIEPAVNTPRSLWATWLFLAVCATLLMIFNVLVTPGAYVMENSAYPMVDVMANLYGEAWHRPFILYLVPSYMCNLLAMLWASGRQLWALSRTGYLPHFLSVTADNKDFVPWRATVVVAIFAYVVSIVVWVLQKNNSESSSITLLLNLTVVSGFVAYMGVGITYIGFQLKYPKVARPFRSPLGIPGAAYLVIVPTVTIIALIFYVVLMGILGLYTAVVGGFHLLPTEDSLMLRWWNKVR
ncbi:hypothetical protein HDU93_004455 [Gonapodya sp. JEL0774]|nr:hypothetical protein HDU93_004455 [Gonapodya sp. JEL0774]